MFELLGLFGLVAFIMAWKTRGRLRLIETRLADIEFRVLSGQTPHAAPPAPAAPEASVRTETPAESAKSEPKPVLEPEPQAAAPTPPPHAPEPEPARSFEERFGTSWTVWVGGLALALGGIFLVQYSIEQGLLGPGVRIVLSGLLAAALVAAGEWARRRELPGALANMTNAHIPSILTAAGTTIAYATVYAAYGLYGFLAPASAFILLGIVALATLAAALLHGPALAALGMVGAYVAPALVASETPNYWALTIYLAVVSGASFALARQRLWRWLAISAVALGALWILPGIHLTDLEPLSAHVAHAGLGYVLAAALIVCGLFYGPPGRTGFIDGISSGSLAVYLFAAALVVTAQHHANIPLFAFAVLTAATLAIAWRTEAATGAVPAAAAFAVLVMVHWAVETQVPQLVWPSGPTAGAVPEPQTVAYGTQLGFGLAFIAAFGIAGFLAQGRSGLSFVSILWAAAGIAAPVAIMIALYYRIDGFDRSVPFAGLALLLAALCGYATELLVKRAPRPGVASAAALYATGAVACLALALTFALEKGWLTVALALMVPGIAWISEKRPLPMLRWLAAAVVALVIARVGWDPRIVGSDVGTTPIVNWLLWGYGVPAASFWLAGWLLRKRADDAPTRIAETAAILFTVLLFALEIRHFINGGDVYRPSSGLTEAALQVCVWIAMAIGLERLRARTGSIVHDAGAQILAVMALAGSAFGLGVLQNPWLTGEPVGEQVINLVLLGYGVPAILMAILARMIRETRPAPLYMAAAIAAIALALGYLTLQVRVFFHGEVLSGARITDAEDYTYSAVWLAFGVALLLAGIALKSQPARFASAAVVILTVAKVFLHDLAGVQGIFRAFSFICLGLVLIGIGWLYQRLLFPPGKPAASPQPPVSPA
jgi:uncharacterized membrane protein